MIRIRRPASSPDLSTNHLSAREISTQVGISLKSPDLKSTDVLI